MLLPGCRINCLLNLPCAQNEVISDEAACLLLPCRSPPARRQTQTQQSRTCTRPTSQRSRLQPPRRSCRWEFVVTAADAALVPTPDGAVRLLCTRSWRQAWRLSMPNLMHSSLIHCRNLCILLLQALSREPDIYEKLAASVAPGIWQLDDIKKGLLCQLFGGTTKVWTYFVPLVAPCIGVAAATALERRHCQALIVSLGLRLRSRLLRDCWRTAACASVHGYSVQPPVRPWQR